MDSEYVYIPDDDSEYGPVWLTSEAREVGMDLSEAKPATLVVSREGSRGHYLAACFLEDAADLVEHEREVNGIGRRVDSGKVAGWRSVAANYNEHGGAYCPGYEHTDTHMCPDCEFIHDTVDEAESELSDRGYVVTWNDGFTIHKVEGESDGE